MLVAPFPQAKRVSKMYPLNASADFEAGAFVLLNGSEEVIECSADPAVVAGIAAGPAAGRVINEDKMLVHLATPQSTFFMSGTSDPDVNDVGVAYGVVDTSGVWQVDLTDTTNTVVQVIAVDLVRNLFEVTVISSVRQLYLTPEGGA